MVTINTVSDTKFSLNGITYGKIYQPLAQGTEHISIVNVYDTNQKLINSTHYSEFTVNGSTYLDQDTLISSLILVIFTIGEGGGSGGGAWGEIEGTLSDQGDLWSALNGKANTSHTHTFASITGKPTTLAGYGITNAYTKTESDGRYLQDETYSTPSELLTAIKTVDGSGSGLDADTLDGLQSSSYARKDISETFAAVLRVRGDLLYLGNSDARTRIRDNNAGSTIISQNTGGGGGIFLRPDQDISTVNQVQLTTTTFTRAGFTIWDAGNDGAGSGLDADLFHGVTASNYARTDITETFNGDIIINGGASSSGALYLSGDVGNSNRHRIRYNGNQLFAIRDDVAGVDRISIDASGIVTINGSLVWTAGNDGAGSNLDADLLDGFQSSTSATANTVAVRNGSGQLYATAFFESSDRSLKENMEYLTPDFVKFNFKDSPNQLRYGVIAQEIEKQNPELVHTNEDGLKSVNYIDLLVLKVVELQKEVKDLKSQING